MLALCIRPTVCDGRSRDWIAIVEFGLTYDIEPLHDVNCRCPDNDSGHAAVLVLSQPYPHTNFCGICRIPSTVSHKLACLCQFVPLEPPVANHTWTNDKLEPAIHE